MMIETIFNNINKDTIFTNNFTYIIVGEIHVLNGITLCIEDNTIILLRNGINKKKNSTIDFSTLIFDTGSTLIAKNIFIKSADKYNKTINYADNGGLIFLGSADNNTYSTYNSINSQLSTTSSNFSADKLIVEYLGSTTNNSITIIGNNDDEFNIKNIKSFYSGNIGLNVINSNIIIDKLTIINPSGEVCLENNNSIINIIKAIKINITNGSISSLFNFLINSPSPYIKINKNTCVYLNAPQFSSIINPLQVVSIDIPSPTSPYFVNKILKKQTYIYRPLSFVQSSTNTTGDFSSVATSLDGTIAIATSLSNTGLWYSTNSGQTWKQSSTNNTGSFNYATITNDGTKAIAASDTTGLWYSENGGQTWIQSTNTTGSFISVAISADGTKAIAGSGSDTGLWYSKNSGQTWTQSADTYSVETNNNSTYSTDLAIAQEPKNSYNILNGDDLVITVVLNNSFLFNGTNYNTIYINSNGTIGFNSASNTNSFSTSYSYASTMSAFFLPWLDTNDPIKIYYKEDINLKIFTLIYDRVYYGTNIKYQVGIKLFLDNSGKAIINFGDIGSINRYSLLGFSFGSSNQSNFITTSLDGDFFTPQSPLIDISNTQANYANKQIVITLSDTGDFSSVAISTDGTKAIAGSGSDAGLWFSDNGGQNWIQSVDVYLVETNNNSTYATDLIVAQEPKNSYNILNGDDKVFTVVLTNSFLFNEKYYNTIYISSNGTIGFNNASNTSDQFPTYEKASEKSAFLLPWVDSDDPIKIYYKEDINLKIFTLIYDRVYWDTNIKYQVGIKLFLDNSGKAIINFGEIGNIDYDSLLGFSFGSSDSSNFITSTLDGYFYPAQSPLIDISNTQENYANKQIVITFNKIKNSNFSSVAISTDVTKAIAASGSNTGLWYSINSGQQWRQSLTNTTGSFNYVTISSDGKNASSVETYLVETNNNSTYATDLIVAQEPKNSYNILNGNDLVITVVLNNSFLFNGTNYNTIYINSNGTIGFNNASNTNDYTPSYAEASNMSAFFLPWPFVGTSDPIKIYYKEDINLKIFTLIYDRVYYATNIKYQVGIKLFLDNSGKAIINFGDIGSINRYSLLGFSFGSGDITNFTTTSLDGNFYPLNSPLIDIGNTQANYANKQIVITVNISTYFEKQAVTGSDSNTGLWYSTNSGQTWIQSLTNTTGNFKSVAISANGKKVIATSISNTGLWFSDDGGQTWIQIFTNITGSFNTVTITEDGTKAIAGSASNTGLWYSI